MGVAQLDVAPMNSRSTSVQPNKPFAHLEILGVIGGIGSGKSEVARRLAEHGAVLLEADRIGHLVLDDPEVKEALRARWGDAVFDQQGKVDRRAVAARVFSNADNEFQELRFLERVVHPRIEAQLIEALQRCQQQAKSGQQLTVVLDAAVLLEAGWSRWCDQILFIDAPEAVRLERARARGWSTQEWHRREAAQWPLDKKRQYATAILPNHGSLDELYHQVDSWWQVWRTGRCHRTQARSPAAGNS